MKKSVILFKQLLISNTGLFSFDFCEVWNGKTIKEKVFCILWIKKKVDGVII